MKRNITLIIGALALIILIGGSYILYNKLSKEYSNGGSSFILNETASPTKDTNQSDSGNNSSNEDSTDKDSTSQDSSNNSSADNNASSTTDTYNDYYNFTVTDWDGNEVQLSDMKGKPIILNFWASWCSPCKAEMPDFEEAYKEHGDEVVFMMINLTDGYRETVIKAKNHVKKEGYTFPVYFDTKSDVAYSFSVSTIPATYLIDENGNIVGHAAGMIDAAALAEAIAILKK